MPETDVASATRVKRLTLDLPADVHRALKLRSVELDIPMVEVLRALIVEALADPSSLERVADTLRNRAG